MPPRARVLRSHAALVASNRSLRKSEEHSRKLSTLDKQISHGKRLNRHLKNKRKKRSNRSAEFVQALKQLRADFMTQTVEHWKQQGAKILKKLRLKIDDFNRTRFYLTKRYWPERPTKQEEEWLKQMHPKAVSPVHKSEESADEESEEGKSESEESADEESEEGKSESDKSLPCMSDDVDSVMEDEDDYAPYTMPRRKDEDEDEDEDSTGEQEAEEADEEEDSCEVEQTVQDARCSKKACLEPPAQSPSSTAVSVALSGRFSDILWD